MISQLMISLSLFSFILFLIVGKSFDASANSQEFYQHLKNTASFGVRNYRITFCDSNMVNEDNLMPVTVNQINDRQMLHTGVSTVDSSKFIGDNVLGIFVENKIHYATLLEYETQYINGLSTLSIIQHSSFIRTPVFV